MASVHLIDVSKLNDQQVILEQINLKIEQGEFVAIMGPSGCGKSTLLRLVAGLDHVSSGRILINDQCVNQMVAAKRDIAMVFQSYALYPHMTVFENMAYALKMRKMKKSLIEQRVREVATLLQLTEYLHRKPQALSGGQRQRVAMGRAIVRSPAVFLFDEPLSNLDVKLRVEMRHEIKRLHQQLNTTCLYVTHDQTEAMTMASKVLVLNQGRVEQVGSPQFLYQQPASLFVAEFTGCYPINFFQGIIDLSTSHVRTELGVELPLPALNTPVSCGDAVVVGVRPEHLTVVSQNTPGAIPIHVEWVDDMGSDRLVHAISSCGKHRFSVRAFADTELTNQGLFLQLVHNKINLFHQKTGLRLGGWA